MKIDLSVTADLPTARALSTMLNIYQRPCWTVVRSKDGYVLTLDIPSSTQVNGFIAGYYAQKDGDNDE